MYPLKPLLLIIFFVLPVVSFSQGVIADSTHGFSQAISKFYRVRKDQDIEGYRKLIHPYYENKAMHVSHEDSLALRWGFSISAFSRVRIYDTVTVDDSQYCKVEYSLNCIKKLSANEMDLVPHLNSFFGASPKLGQDGYFDKSTNTYKYYPKRWALMVLKKGASAWRILEYNPKDVESSFGIEPREVLYAVEGLDETGCQSPNYTQEQLGKLVYQSMMDDRPTSLYCAAGIQRTELMWTAGKERKHMTENDFYMSLIYKKGKIDKDSKRMYAEYPWKDTKFSQVYSVVEKVNDMSFSAILVEFMYESKHIYFEVESVLTPAGWRIIDDINMGSFRPANEAPLF
jgi:hypothetical protein